jgi:hypothetical protein
MIWEDLVPKNVAVAQRKWERRRKAILMRKAGFTYSHIGKVLGMTAAGAHDQARELVLIKLYGGFQNRLKEMSPPSSIT